MQKDFLIFNSYSNTPIKIKYIAAIEYMRTL